MGMPKFGPYLLGSHTILLTDHSSLTALTGGKQMKNMRQQRYAVDLAELSLTILHRAGTAARTAEQRCADWEGPSCASAGRRGLGRRVRARL